MNQSAAHAIPHDPPASPTAGAPVVHDVAVVGAGPGGYATALRAAELGLDVVLVERDATLGGTCLNRGCIPSKALIGATHAVETVRDAAAVGVRASVEGIDFAALGEHRRRTVATMTDGLASLVAARGIDVRRGEVVAIDRLDMGGDAAAAAADARTFRLAIADTSGAAVETAAGADASDDDPAAGARTHVLARHVVVATGSQPRPMPGHPFGGPVIDSTQALELDRFPDSAVIVGAGAIALEFASMWNAAGTHVTLLIRKDRVLSGWDRRAGMTLTRELRRRGVDVVTRSAVAGIDIADDGHATVRYTRDGGDETAVDAQVVLAAIGREPATDADWFDRAGIARDAVGHVVADPLGRTSADGIYAVGDVTAGHALAHRAFAQGIVVAESIAGLDPEPVDEDTVPSIVFSTPEAAAVGLTAEQARARGGYADVAETAYPMRSNARMMMAGAAGSLTLVTGRIVDAGPADGTPDAARPDAAADDATERTGEPVVLGATVVAPGASDLIAELQQIVGNRIPLSRAARLVHPHPTFAETVGEALLKADGRPLHTR
ncbi:dihydrolipoyl dehydrogenase family protein [Bifidobacterium samirii]|uniref:Dihydrolipoamide dehydrogenase n=1 Tax=Bifidobacterium samirii TaxID=2306974 RepID=A0A430FTX5_9BIFI|nr:FAD-dependent oxidoreductase [Bifidobacterium samirii]RSX56358.1 dihydrolipoamide dehydrogenase [Bifidobacterium samirii]